VALHPQRDEAFTHEAFRRARRSGAGEFWEPGAVPTCLHAAEATVERESVFEDFYRAERATILRAVVYALEDADLGAEAADEAWARAYERWGDVGAMANPAGWVFRVAVNHGRNRHRRRLLERRTPPPPDRDRPDVGAVADPALARALARLPLDQRTVIVLRFHLDWSIDTIAESLGCAPGTVKSRLHRGLQRLESMLEAPV
jgi:RNA polymerase sigma factor (sigma-70 family)